MQDVVKWPNILQKSCGVHTARFLKYVWSFYNIMHERVKPYHPQCSFQRFVKMYFYFHTSLWYLKKVF